MRGTGGTSRALSGLTVQRQISRFAFHVRPPRARELGRGCGGLTSGPDHVAALLDQQRRVFDAQPRLFQSRLFPFHPLWVLDPDAGEPDTPRPVRSRRGPNRPRRRIGIDGDPPRTLGALERAEVATIRVVVIW